MPLLWRHKPRTQPKPQQTRPYYEEPPNVASTLGYEIHLEPKQTASHLDAMFEGLS